MFRFVVKSAMQNAKFASVCGVQSLSSSNNLQTPITFAKPWNRCGVLGHKNNYSADTNSKVITCRAAVFRGVDEAAKVEEIQVEPPRTSEIRIKMLYASLCHSDILCATGAFGHLFPRVLGHEGVGVVESVGDGVTEFKEGDLVIPTFLGECHECENCASGKTNICPNYPLHLSGLMGDGTSRMSVGGHALYHTFSCSTWSEYTVLNTNYAVKVDPRIHLPHASCLSCGFSSGFGAPWKQAKIDKKSSVAVIGLGAVGLGAIEGARVQGAGRIIGIDKKQMKGVKGKAFGMTDFINSSESDKPVSDLIKDLTGGMGVDYCIECTGVGPMVQEALESTKPGVGCALSIGVVNKPTVEIPHMTLLIGRSLKGSLFGGIKTKTELPTVIGNIINKGIKLDELLTHEISLDEIGKAFDLLKQPDCVKVLIKI